MKEVFPISSERGKKSLETRKKKKTSGIFRSIQNENSVHFSLQLVELLVNFRELFQFRKLITLYAPYYYSQYC